MYMDQLRSKVPNRKQTYFKMFQLRTFFIFLEPAFTIGEVTYVQTYPVSYSGTTLLKTYESPKRLRSLSDSYNDSNNTKLS